MNEYFREQVAKLQADLAEKVEQNNVLEARLDQLNIQVVIQKFILFIYSLSMFDNHQKMFTMFTVLNIYKYAGQISILCYICYYIYTTYQKTIVTFISIFWTIFPLTY